MPFPQQPEQLFTKEGIEWLAAGQTGCYGLYRQGQWIYVGKSDDFRRRMLEHFNGDNPCITRARPTHYVTVLVNPQTLGNKL